MQILQWINNHFIFLTIVTIYGVLAALKAANYISCSWWWFLSPLLLAALAIIAMSIGFNRIENH